MLIRKLGSPAILFFTLPWLMILLIVGTVAQRDMGLYAAQQMFFSAWFVWLGPIPLPGTYLTLGAITLCLLVKFIFLSPWIIKQAGTILTHLGILVLLIGGMITALTQKEGFIAIGEGQESRFVNDYHDRVLHVQRNDADFATIPYDRLKEKTLIPVNSLPFKARIDALCINCRPAPVKDASTRKGLAEQISLKDAPPEKENEANLSGLTLNIEGSGDSQDGIYVMMEEIPHTPEITIDNDIYRFSIERAQTILPFEILLKDFKRELHPGTDTPRDFSSQIVIKDNGIEWPYLIRMNEPLRYKGYTLYQASFSIRPDGEYTVLSVVQNKGRVFPYIASAIIFVGLLLHVILRLQRKSVKG